MTVAYDPRHQTWDSWASLMCEAYATQNLSIPDGEENWKGWAAGFVGIDLFAKDAMPDPYNFDDWQEWAVSVVNTLSPSSGV